MSPYLGGLELRASGAPDGPAWRAGDALAELGATVERVRSPGTEALRSDRSLTTIGWGRGTRLEAEYLGLRAASAHLAGARGIARTATRDLREGADRPGARLVRCADGWLVARWRSPTESTVLDRMVGGTAIATRSDAWRAAREARLLVAPVRARARARPRVDAVVAPATGSSTRRTIVDWTNLWAGPWATGRLAGATDVVRVEVPTRRDGLLRTARGRSRWQRWNGRKRLALLDARVDHDHDRLAELIAGADVLVFGQSARVLSQLGFDDAWFAREAPHVFRLSLVAYDEPHDDSPGLGEHAAALSGLLWRGPDRRPAPPYPWADPLLAAWALLVLRARDAAGRPIGGTIRLSLESAAARAAIRCPGGRDV